MRALGSFYCQVKSKPTLALLGMYIPVVAGMLMVPTLVRRALPAVSLVGVLTAITQTAQIICAPMRNEVDKSHAAYEYADLNSFPGGIYGTCLSVETFDCF